LEIALIRHGQTDSNADGVLQGIEHVVAPEQLTSTKSFTSSHWASSAG